mmetsp:Transcript_5157/g.5355  ORF Transcript_5157/g.5355 Transcript_5157/m.5355 type:complete len:147 (-) Transcript_5157:43-483(-)
MLYVLIGQLTFSQSFATIVAVLMGFVGCAIVTSPPILALRLELPEFFYSWGERLFGMFVDEAPVPRMSAAQAQLMQARLAQPGLRRPAAAAPQPPAPAQPAPPPPPSEEAIESLTGMGFDRESAIRALGRCDNNVEHAVNRLLNET